MLRTDRVPPKLNKQRLGHLCYKEQQPCGHICGWHAEASYPSIHEIDNSKAGEVGISAQSNLWIQ